MTKKAKNVIRQGNGEGVKKTPLPTRKKVHTKLEGIVDNKIRHKAKKKRKLGDLKIMTSLGWIFVLPIILAIFLGMLIEGFLGEHKTLMMVVFILSAVVISSFNIFYLLKRTYREIED